MIQQAVIPLTRRTNNHTQQRSDSTATDMSLIGIALLHCLFTAMTIQ